MSNDYTNELNELAATVATVDDGFACEDDQSPIQIVDREIKMPNDCVYAVCCDDKSQLLTFQLPRFVEGVDLSKRIASIKFKNANNDADRAKPFSVVASGDNLTVVWRLDGAVTAKDGAVTFQIEFYEVIDGQLYSWQTKMATFNVLPTLDVDGNIKTPTPTWVQEVTAEIFELNNMLKEKVSSSEVILKHDSNKIYNTGDIVKIIDNFDNLVAFKATKDNMSANVDYQPNERIATIPASNLLSSFILREGNLTEQPDGTYIISPSAGSLPLYMGPNKSPFEWGHDADLDMQYLQCSTSGSGYQLRIAKDDASAILSNNEVTFDFWAKFNSKSSPHTERLLVITNDTTSAAAPANTQLKVEVNKVNDRWRVVVVAYTDMAIQQQKMNLAFDKWNHFVVSRKILSTKDGWSTINFSLWINGVHISTVTLQEPESDPATTIYFGGNSGATNAQRFSGCLGPIKIYNKVPTTYLDGWKQIDSIVDHKGYCSNYSYIVDLYKSKHDHENKEALDGITEEAVKKWNGYEDVIKAMQQAISKMIKPEYITNASYIFAGGVNAELLTALNTEYIEVADSTFKGNPNENISFNAINCESMQHCFENSLAVTITFPNGTPKLIYANNIFSKCAGLASVSGLDCTNVITFKYGFNGCASLEVVDLGSTAKVKDFSYGFYGSGIKTITGLDTSSAEHLDGAWAKSAIEDLTLDCTNVISAVGVFTDCLSLLALTLKNLTNSDVAFEMFYSLPTTESGTIILENCAISDDIKAIATEKGWLINEQ